MGLEGEGSHDRGAVQFAVDVGEVADFGDGVELPGGGDFLGVDAEQDEVGLVAVELVGDPEDFFAGGAVDEAFGVEAGGAVGAAGLGLLPSGGGGDVVDFVDAIAADFDHEAVGVEEVDAASGGAGDGACVDRDVVGFEDFDGAIEAFWVDVEGEVVGAGELLGGVGVGGLEIGFPKEVED